MIEPCQKKILFAFEKNISLTRMIRNSIISYKYVDFVNDLCYLSMYYLNILIVAITNAIFCLK